MGDSSILEFEAEKYVSVDGQEFKKDEDGPQ